ncbi:hypothetical protein [Listeria grayi]|uniref:hypothetical protein n=1 Tax=Listeria grayi TaxID=1641 RepID=UPI00162A98ED|nr:hypothetical protein [Listeria grayi]MBC1922993.1 hypothetical protein [Listeria grayi]
MEIEFFDGKELDIQEGLRLSYEKALELCIRKNEEIYAIGIVKHCQYRLLSAGKTVYESVLRFPYDSFDFLAILQEELAGKKQGEALLAWIEEEIQPTKRRNRQETTRSPKKKKTIDQSRKRLSKRWLIGITAFLVVCIMGVLGVLFLKQPAKQAPSLDTLLNKKEYVAAAKAYPDKKEGIANQLLEEAMKGTTKGVQEYKQFLSQINLPFSTFDTAVLNHDFRATIAAYEKQQAVIQKSDKRMVILGYAYLKDKQVDKAKKIANQFAHVDLEKRVAQWEQLQLAIQNRQAAIKKLQKHPIKNEKAIQKEIERLFKDKEAIEKL